MSSREREAIPSLPLEGAGDQRAIRGPPPISPVLAPRSVQTSASGMLESWESEARPSPSTISVCSSGPVPSFSLVVKKPEPGLSESLSTLPSSSFLRDLELSAEDIMTGSHSITRPYCEPQWQPAEDDLSLSPPGSPALQSSNPINAMTWAAMSRNIADDDVADMQPWKPFWPPPLGSHLFDWVESRRPEALAFTFDPANHLLHQNHPWQSWKDEHPAAVEPSEDEEVSLDMRLDRETGLMSISSRQAGDDLDDLIQVDLQLPSVTPKQFNYLRPLRRYYSERPYRLQLPAGLLPIPVTNVFAKSYPVRIYDMSGHEDKFKLDAAGFQFMKCPVSVGEWSDEAITKTYLPALLDWVVELLDGESGLIYSFNFRHHLSDRFVPVQRAWSLRHDPISHTAIGFWDDTLDDGDDSYSMTRYLKSHRRDDPYNNIYAVRADPSGPCRWKKPLFRVHCDASENTHERRLPLLRPNDAQKLASGRVREISVWRKLSECPQDTPLALCDARTVEPGDLVPMDVVYPHFADEVYEVRYNKNHRWFYNKEMTTDDVAIFMLHDTQNKDLVCPHSAFLDPTVPGGTPPRLSIEVKIMIFGG